MCYGCPLAIAYSADRSQTLQRAAHHTKLSTLHAGLHANLPRPPCMPVARSLLTHSDRPPQGHAITVHRRRRSDAINPPQPTTNHLKNQPRNHRFKFPEHQIARAEQQWRRRLLRSASRCWCWRWFPSPASARCPSRPARAAAPRPAAPTSSASSRACPSSTAAPPRRRTPAAPTWAAWCTTSRSASARLSATPARPPSPST